MDDEQLQELIAGDEQFIQYIQQNPELMEKIQQNPELLRQLYQDYTGKAGVLDEKLEQAKALRAGTPEGIHAGGFYTAASPLSHLAGAGSDALSSYQQQKAMKGMEKLSDDQSEGLQGLIELMMAKELRKNQQLDVNSLVDEYQPRTNQYS